MLENKKFYTREGGVVAFIMEVNNRKTKGEGGWMGIVDISWIYTFVYMCNILFIQAANVTFMI